MKRYMIVPMCAAVVACTGDSSPTAPSGGSSGGLNDRIKLEAVVANRSGQCPTLTFQLGGITVQTTAATDFELACQQIVDGTLVEVDGPSFSANVLQARQVDTDTDGDVDPGFDVEGPIGALGDASTCTTTGRQVTMLGFSFVVGSFTAFKDLPAGCGGLMVGDMVRAKGPLTNPPAAPISPLRADELEPQ